MTKHRLAWNGLMVRAPAPLARVFGRDSKRVLYRGGPILTMDAGNRVVEALLVEGDRIAAVGGDAELRDRADQRRRVVDLRGKALLPGFIDAHAHFPGAGIFAVLLDLNSPPIGDIERMDTLVERLRERAASTSKGDWVVGMGYDDTLLAEGRHPTRTDLDRASTEHPIAIWHVSGHLAVVNSTALERVGIDAKTPDAEGGRIRRDPVTGEPDGVLEENDTHVLQPLLAPGLRDSWKIVREASHRYLSAGVTTAQNGYATAKQMKALLWLSRLGLLPLRVILWPGQETADAMLDGRFAFESPDPLWIRQGAE